MVEPWIASGILAVPATLCVKLVIALIKMSRYRNSYDRKVFRQYLVL